VCVPFFLQLSTDLAQLVTLFSPLRDDVFTSIVATIITEDKYSTEVIHLIVPECEIVVYPNATHHEFFISEGFNGADFDRQIA
jgi:hypothetical protein